MIISDFTRPEIDYFLNTCNFTDVEQEFFMLRTKGITLDEISEIMNVSRRTCDTYSKKIKRKIIKVL